LLEGSTRIKKKAPFNREKEQGTYLRAKIIIRPRFEWYSPNFGISHLVLGLWCIINDCESENVWLTFGIQELFTNAKRIRIQIWQLVRIRFLFVAKY